MENTNHESSRPAAVTSAVVILAVSSAIGLVKGVVKMVDRGHGHFAIFAGVMVAVIAGVIALVTYLIFQGTNWARWFFLVLFTIGVLSSPGTIRTLQAQSSFDVVFYGLQLLLQLIAAVALCLPSSRRWFRASSNRA